MAFGDEALVEGYAHRVDGAGALGQDAAPAEAEAVVAQAHAVQ